MWNALTHSGSETVAIAVRSEPNGLTLEVSDHGKGFVVQAIRRGRSLGIVSMEERARLIGAELEVASSPGQGAVVRLRLKLEEPT